MRSAANHIMHLASHHLGYSFIKVKRMCTACSSIPYALSPLLLPASLYHVVLCAASPYRARLRHANRNSCPLSGRRKLLIQASACFLCKGSITRPCALPKASLCSCPVAQESGVKPRNPCNRGLPGNAGLWRSEPTCAVFLQVAEPVHLF